MKKFIITNAIVIIMLSVFLFGYTAALECPVYADSTTDEWTQVTTNQQMVQAFQVYCKSRNLAIEGSVLDAVTSVTTKVFNDTCNSLGIDVTALQAHIKYKTDGNQGLQWFFDDTGIAAYNRIFAEFLQNNDLAVGDTADEQNNTLYSGAYFTDYDGYTSLVYEVDYSVSNAQNEHSFVHEGSYYKYSYNDLINMDTAVYRLTSTMIYNQTVYHWNDIPRYSYASFRSTNNINVEADSLISAVDLQNADKVIRRGFRAIIKYDSKYYYGHVLYLYGSSIDNNAVTGTYWTCIAEIPQENDNIQPTTIYITTNNTTINNNNYQGDTIINNNGTPDDGNNNPGGGGGTTITPPGTIGGGGSDGTINFPDFNLDLPEINWSLGDLSSKFPFCIPFDMIAFLRLLNGEPQAPHITGSIPLTSHYTWNLDLDFSQFDTFAGIMRGLEFVGFMFFLISVTINIVRG